MLRVRQILGDSVRPYSYRISPRLVHSQFEPLANPTTVERFKTRGPKHVLSQTAISSEFAAAATGRRDPAGRTALTFDCKEAIT